MYGVLHAADIRVDGFFKEVNNAMSSARTTSHRVSKAMQEEGYSNLWWQLYL